MISSIVCILITILILSCSCGGVLAYYSNEGDALSKKDAGNLCDNFDKNAKYVCPYGRNACKLHNENGYSNIYCPFNYALIADKPVGTRQKIMSSIFNGSVKKEDIYNENYFIKKEDRILKQITYDLDNNKCEDINTGNFVNLYNDGLIEKSRYSGVNKSYIYVSYKLFVDFNINILSGGLKIDTLDDLNKEFNNIKETLISCENVLYKERESEKYKMDCLFYDTFDIPVISDTFIETFIPAISRDILVSYYASIKLKIQLLNKVSLFEYVMYITLENYLNDRNYKYIINVK